MVAEGLCQDWWEEACMGTNGQADDVVTKGAKALAEQNISEK